MSEGKRGQLWRRWRVGMMVDSDDILVEVWRCLGETWRESCGLFFQIVFCLGWRSVLALTFKKKHNVQTCSNYRGMISYIMKPWERVDEALLSRGGDQWAVAWPHAEKEHHRCDVYYDSADGELQRSSEGVALCIFVDLEKAFDRVPIGIREWQWSIWGWWSTVRQGWGMWKAWPLSSK